MPRVDEPKPDLQKIRLGLGLTTEEAARRIGITDSVLVHYESQGWGYDKDHDTAALDAYLMYAITAYGSDAIYYRYFPLATKENGPGGNRSRSSNQKGHRS